MIVDLRSKYGYAVRQVDHRTIESIILKNVKYVLKNSKNKDISVDTVDSLKIDKCWNFDDLKIDDFFSQTIYIKVLKENKNTYSV